MIAPKTSIKTDGRCPPAGTVAKCPPPLRFCFAGGIRLRRERKFDRESGALARTVAPCPQRPLVCIDRGLRDRQPQPEPAELPADRFAPLVKGIEDMLRHFRLETDAGIGNVDHDPAG